MTDDQPGPELDLPPESALADDPLTAARLIKLDRLAATGVDPYPARFERTALAGELHTRHAGLAAGESTGEQVSVAGRVVLHRSFGKLVFATISDPSGRIQLMASAADLADFDRFADIDPGDWVGATGEVVTTRKGELTVRVAGLTLLAKGLRPLPEKWHGLSDIERRSRQRYLDLIVNPAARQIAQTRARVVSELRSQFQDRGYIEVETPVLLNQAGGALARPFATHHHALDLDMYLRIATELPLKMLIVGGLEKVFEIGRIFRNEGIDSTHNPEFTMLESYQALADYLDILGMVEEVMAAVATTATGSARFSYQDRQLDLSPPYRRARMVDLVGQAVGEQVWPDRSIADLTELAGRHHVAITAGLAAGQIIEQLFDELVAPSLWDPVFVLDHPVDISPLARRRRDDPTLAERFELFIAGVEYANAYSELNDPIDQRRRLVSQARARDDAEAHPVDEPFLRALEYGMPPTGGLGIGVDRLVMLLTGQTQIREVILFPTLRPEA